VTKGQKYTLLSHRKTSPFGAAALYAFCQILTRKLSNEDSRALLLYPAYVGALLMISLLP